MSKTLYFSMLEKMDWKKIVPVSRTGSGSIQNPR